MSFSSSAAVSTSCKSVCNIFIFSIFLSFNFLFFDHAKILLFPRSYSRDDTGI
jgi:hypothetical protein